MSVTARPFGPFANASLEFGPGLNIIFGPNGSGKSSWHAALYAGLCGVRRARGQPRLEDREFANQFKPWDAEEWQVSALVALHDGRVVELHHDLAGTVDCRARDMTLGDDISSEIIFDGGPDGSRWLGLDRKAFLATACVRQAEILDVLRDAGVLQENLQRAADTGGRDETAAAALSRIDEFRREEIGQDRANSTKPLHLAMERKNAGRQALDRAQQQRAEYVRLVTDLEEADRLSAEASRQLRLAEAARALTVAGESEQRLVRVRKLLERFPKGAPAAWSDDDTLAQEVASAVNGLENRPPVSILSGQTAAQLRDELTALPLPPEGDTEPHPTVTSAAAAFADARRTVELHCQMRPPDLVVPETGGASSEDLREMARDLSIEKPTLDPGLNEQILQAGRRLTALKLRSRLFFLAGAGLGCGAALAFWIRSPVPGALLGLAAAALVVWATSCRAATTRESTVLADAEMKRGLAAERNIGWKARNDAARSEASTLRLEPEPVKLRALAEGLEAVAGLRQHLEQWTAEDTSRRRAHGRASSDLAEALGRRGVAATADPEAAIAGYLQACSDRARVASVAGRRPALETQLATREMAEAAVLAAESARARAAQSLRDAASRCNLSAPDEPALAESLRAWLGKRGQEIKAEEAAQREWAELQAMLKGRTVADLETEASTRRNAATELSRDFQTSDLAGVASKGDLAGQLPRLRAADQQERSEADKLAGQVKERNARLLPVAEAEEELEAAEGEVSRIQRLEVTLLATRTFLERAQASVHRSIAPVLKMTIKPWLPHVTAGHYDDVIVNPETLAVQVHSSNGHWRDATRLSHGTKEQIYLLLRMAMARHLTQPKEVCPLLLDDVTVQSDAERTKGILSLLKAISQERQVILFSQEEDVLAWAEINLGSTSDRLLRLDSATIQD